MVVLDLFPPALHKGGMIIHFRHQYPVGQGCFHAAFIGVQTKAKAFAQPGIRYVYDCGSMGKYKVAREREIVRFHNDSDKLPLDFLFLSHLHEDHVSGAEMLCGPQGSDVDTVVLPLLNVIDRLICFARAVSDNPDYANEFHEALTADPVRALSRLNPRQIIFVRRGGDDGAPSPGEPGEPDTDGPGDIPSDEGGRRPEGLKWRLIGTGRSRRLRASSRRISRDIEEDIPDVFEVDDTCAIAIDVPSEGMSWILAPYVDPEVAAARDLFLQKAADLFGITKEEFERQAESSEWLLHLVASHKGTLSKAYTAIADLNVTSLCLFSGPFEAKGPWNWHARFGQITWRSEPAVNVGWMGTGDADLKKPARRQAFLNHYAAHLPHTGTLLLPHHGSDHNFDPALLDGVNARLSVAAADAYKNWRHPGSEVIQAVSSRGFPLWVVTSSSNARLDEFTWQSQV